jgi:hypothetical protein
MHDASRLFSVGGQHAVVRVLEDARVLLADGAGNTTQLAPAEFGVFRMASSRLERMQSWAAAPPMPPAIEAFEWVGLALLGARYVGTAAWWGILAVLMRRGHGGD